MVTPQPPTLQVFVSAQAVLPGDMALQHLPPCSRNPGKLHSRDAQIAEPIQRESELARAERAVQADQGLDVLK